MPSIRSSTVVTFCWTAGERSFPVKVTSNTVARCVTATRTGLPSMVRTLRCSLIKDWVPVRILVIVRQGCAERPRHLLVILDEVCKQVGRAKIQHVLCCRRYGLGHRSYDRFVICQCIVQHL